MGKHRFYCVHCNRFVDRRMVTASYDETAETKYYCKWCCNPVIKVQKVIDLIVMETLLRIIKSGRMEDFE